MMIDALISDRTGRPASLHFRHCGLRGGLALQRSYQQPRDRIAEAVLSPMELPGLVLPGKRAYQKVFTLYRQGGLGFADCYHAVLMERGRTWDTLSFDTDFDRVPAIRRREE